MLKKGLNFILTEHQLPHREVRSVVDSVTFSIVQGRLVADERHRVKGEAHLIQVCSLKLQEHERAIISGFNLLFAMNDFDIALEFCVEPMFEVHPEHSYSPEDLVVEDDNGEKHPDETGTPMFCVPSRRYDGVVHPEDRCIYKPRYAELGFNVPAYAGLENHILNANSTCISEKGIHSDYRAFKSTDPFLVYILQNRHLFKELRDDDIRAYKSDETAPLYLVRKTFVERVQEFFKSALFPLFNYTHNDAVRIAWKTQPKMHHTSCTHPVVTLMFQLDFIVVSPSLPNIKEKVFKF